MNTNNRNKDLELLMKLLGFTPEKGEIYAWENDHFEAVPRSDLSKVVIGDDAMEMVRRVRGEVTRVLRVRADYTVVASAMLLAAAEIPDLAERIRQYGARMYQPRAE